VIAFPLASNWAIHIAHAFWQSTFAAIIVLLLLHVFPGATPRLRHAIVVIALIKFVLPPMLPLPTGIFSAAPPVNELTLVRDAVAAVDVRILAALMLLHAGGAAIMLVRLAAEALHLRGIRRRAANAGRYLVSNEIAVPITTGVWRPAILVPAALVESLSPAELRDVLAHEEQHVRNRDVLVGMLQSLVVAVWWFHPLAHRLAGEGRALREDACDDALIAGGACDRAHYARTLLSAATLAFGRTSAAAASIAESEHSLVRRIRRIADARFAPSLRLGLAAALVVLLAALVLLPGLRVSASNRFAFDHATRHALRHH
jgi:D-alanyl-D-alanine endopeptidase (penicillin-binding protein 7)